MQILRFLKPLFVFESFNSSLFSGVPSDQEKVNSYFHHEPFLKVEIN